jgi:hypothetical protein
MARKNTPPQYKCSICGEFGHNARTCPQKANGVKSPAAILKEERAARRELRIARNAEKEAKKLAKLGKVDTFDQKVDSFIDSLPTVETEVVSEVAPDSTDEVLKLLAQIEQINASSSSDIDEDEDDDDSYSSIQTEWIDDEQVSAK